MTKTELKAMKVDELKELAVSWGVELPEGAKKADIVETLLAEQEKRENDTLEFGNMEMGEAQSSEVVDTPVEKSIDEILAEAESGNDGSELTAEEKAFEDSARQQDSEDQLEGVEDHSAVPVEMVDVSEITPTQMNFFKPLTPAKYAELKESIANNGLLVPIIIRSNVNGVEGDKKYEILAGENRFRVFLDLGKTEIPARIMEVSDDKAKEILVDTNVAQRSELSPMEIARAYDEKKRILGNRQGKRTDLSNEEQAGTTRDLIAQEYGKSGMTVDRYLRLMNLIPEFQELVDNGEIPAKTGMELGLLDKDIQKKIWKTSKKNVEALSTKNVSKVKTLLNEKKKGELKKEENKDKKKDEVAVTVSPDEIDEIFNQGDLVESNKPLKFTVTVPSDTDEETKEFIEGNLVNDNKFLVSLIADYVHGRLVPNRNKDEATA